MHRVSPSARDRERFIALVGVCDRRLGHTFLAKGARLYGFGIAASYAILLLFDPADPLPILRRALGTLAWIVGGLVSLAAAKDAGADTTSGLALLARQRGVTRHELEAARWVGSALRIARLTGVPALALAAIAAAHAPASVGLAEPLHWALGSAGFAIALGVGLATLARGAAWLSPERGRIALVCLVVLPVLAAELWPAAPRLDAAYGRLLALTLGRGAA